MTKWADYLISHVKRNSYGIVTSVLLHKDNGDTTSLIGSKNKDEVINLIKRGFTVKTIVWGYPKWSKGADVHIVMHGTEEHIRTDRNDTDKDNLDNLIPLY